MKNWIRSQFRKKTRVYIMPTKMGGYLIGLIFLMFLLSIGYDNNLLLIFTLFLFSFNVLWLIQSHFHLHHLKLRNIILQNGHTDESLSFKLFWNSSPKAPVNWNICLETKDNAINAKVLEQNEHFFQGELKLPKRGLWNWSYLKVSSILPFGLYRVWSFIPLNYQSYSYPALKKDFSRPEIQLGSVGESVPQHKAGNEDVWNLSNYEGGESRKISWKHYARSGELLIKEGEAYEDPSLRITLNIPEAQKEEYLSDVASQMVYCWQKGIPFLFEAPKNTLGPNKNQEHLIQCLKVLTLC